AERDLPFLPEVPGLDDGQTAVGFFITSKLTHRRNRVNTAFLLLLPRQPRGGQLPGVLPLRDDIPSRRFPALTLVIIVANVAAFLFELGQGREIERFLFTWGFVPARYTDARIASHTLSELVAPFFTSMFLHGGWMHLIGNMWILWIFGDNVEDRLGRLGFLALYLVGGCIATTVHLITNAHSTVP